MPNGTREDDTWHARCHTHRLHVSRLLGGGHVGVSHPHRSKFAIEEKNKEKKTKGRE